MPEADKAEGEPAAADDEPAADGDANADLHADHSAEGLGAIAQATDADDNDGAPAKVRGAAGDPPRRREAPPRGTFREVSCSESEAAESEAPEAGSGDDSVDDYQAVRAHRPNRRAPAARARRRRANNPVAVDIRGVAGLYARATRWFYFSKCAWTFNSRVAFEVQGVTKDLGQRG